MIGRTSAVENAFLRGLWAGFSPTIRQRRRNFRYSLGGCPDGLGSLRWIVRRSSGQAAAGQQTSSPAPPRLPPHHGGLLRCGRRGCRRPACNEGTFGAGSLAQRPSQPLGPVSAVDDYGSAYRVSQARSPRGTATTLSAKTRHFCLPECHHSFAEWQSS